MKSLKDYIIEAKKVEIPKFIIPMYDVCNDLAWAGTFNSRYGKKIQRNEINIDKLSKWFEENDSKLSDQVKMIVKIANAIKDKSDNIEEIYHEGLKKRCFDPYLTSAGRTNDVDNRKCMPGMSEAIAYMMAIAEDNHLKLGNIFADEEVRRLTDWVKK